MPPAPNMKFTMVAGRAMDFATTFNAFFAAGLRGPVHYNLDLTTPVGPSTSGGKQALQHLRLLPADGSAVIVIGSVNGVDKTAEIRSLQALAEVHSQRFKGATLPIDPVAYQTLARDLQSFFTGQGFTIKMASPSMMPPAAGASTGSRKAAWIAVAFAVFVLLVLAATMGFFWLRDHAPK